jgi:hypothetical protein
MDAKSSLLATLLLAQTGIAGAAGPGFPSGWINPGFFTHHFESGDFREENYGPGVELVLAPQHALLPGSFINSDRERSRYAAYYWRPCAGRPARSSSPRASPSASSTPTRA